MREQVHFSIKQMSRPIHRVYKELRSGASFSRQRSVSTCVLHFLSFSSPLSPEQRLLRSMTIPASCLTPNMTLLSLVVSDYSFGTTLLAHAPSSAGTAGNVIAARLAEDRNRRVLVIEAGRRSVASKSKYTVVLTTLQQ